MTIFLRQDYVLTSILVVKEKYFREPFVTYAEFNTILSQMRNQIIENNLDIIIERNEEDSMFIANGTWVPTRPTKWLENYFKEFSMIHGIYDLIWNEDMILNTCLALKENQLQTILARRK